METRKHLAAEKKRCNTHNCTQAVVCTYCDLVGLDEQTALASITKDAAEITGLSDRIGTLESGKDADIIAFSGDPLDVRSHCLLTLINGKIVHKDGEFLIHA